ncbi:uncharacterized protein LOC118418956 isoform X4 [Branchiostoma floridae]|uniref:Uncharacterized protein LOC118418956 isoform X4 n=1 Tax=Branchiostoma floridae TaxID=7739 RepID=A0A9J7LFA7_BRAFL|nr:uncharacterized protein LOC118418956 isoform X4 [Branchiostoma floridae]
MGRRAGKTSGVGDVVVLAALLGLAGGVVVPTTYGEVNGVELPTSFIGGAVFDRIYTFKGIPYAAPPVGDLRWRPPQDPAGWTGVRDAAQFGARCPQVVEMPFPPGSPLYELSGPFRSNSSSEDCLFLNVYTPNVASTADLPVMVWLHGGGLAIGSADTYPAEIPTSLNNVVMVTINYRLGNLGFLPTRDAETDGNVALMDMAKALQWVQANIRNFGGDPDRVTIFGQSGGAWGVSLLVMSPETRGLYRRAISQSGVAGLGASRRGDTAKTENLAASLNCPMDSFDDMMSCLRSKPAHDLLELDAPVPIVGGSFLPDADDLWDIMYKKQVNEVDYLLGTMDGEFSYGLLAAVPQVTADGLDRTVFEEILPAQLNFIAAQFPDGNVDNIVQPVIDQYMNPDSDDPIYTRDRFIQLMTDYRFTATTVLMAQAVAAHDTARVYQYEFQHHTTSVSPERPPYAKADHGDDLFYMFGIPLLRDDTGASWKYSFTQEERDLSLDMMAYWVNFAANGDPSDFTGAARMRDLVTWPRYMTSSQSYLKLDVTSSADVKIRESNMKFWNEEVPRLMGKDVIAVGDDFVVSTTHGDVRGSEFLTSSVVGNALFDRVFTFKGIPYAAPPVGDLRWRPPQDPAGWTGVRDVTEFGARCPQVEYPLPHPIYGEVLGSGGIASSEDCLFLNVYTPNVSDTANLPVMVWIHGGAWYFGSSSTYPAEIPTSLNNVVMVTINYRLGNLGFLPTLDDDAPGNFGLLDAIKALEWVQSNIQNFGGDPDRVTIFGESAGGWSVSLLVMSPMATGLFHRAISQSGVAGVPVAQKGDITLTQNLALSLNCSTDSYDDMMSCLRGLPSEDFLTLMAWPVVIDGRFLLQSPWDLMNHKFINRVDYLLGTNNDEFGLLLSVDFPFIDADGMTRAEFETNLPIPLQTIADQYWGGSVNTILQPVIDQYLDPAMADDPIYLRDQFQQLLMDAFYAAPTVMMAKAESGMLAVAWEASSRVYQYELQHRASVFSYFRPAFVTGADHADDLYFVFGLPLLRDDTGNSWKYSYTQEERDLSLDMMAYWVNFATNGDPNDSTGAARMRNLVTWPRYMTSSQSYLKLAVTSSTDVKIRESNMKFWNEEVPRLMGKDINTGSGGIPETSCSIFVLAFTFVVSYLMA